MTFTSRWQAAAAACITYQRMHSSEEIGLELANIQQFGNVSRFGSDTVGRLEDAAYIWRWWLT